MSRQRLAIVGASVRSAAQSALRAGFDVVGADLFADTDLDGVCPITKIPGEKYPHALRDWLAQQTVDAWMYTGALENYPELVDEMAEIAPLWGVSGEPLRRCRDPMFLQEVFREAGIAFPETRLASEGIPDEGTWLAKTYRASNGAGLWRILDQQSYSKAKQANAYIQKHIAPCTPYAVILLLGPEGPKLVMACRQLIGQAPHGRFLGAVSVRPPYLDRRLIDRLGNCLADRLGLTGIVGVDLVEADRRFFVLEVNPRYTASTELFDRATSASAVALHASSYRSIDTKELPNEMMRAHGKQILYAPQAATIGEEFVSWAKTHDVADIPSVGTPIEAGQPICTVFAQQGRENQVLRLLELLAQETLQCLYQGSRL